MVADDHPTAVHIRQNRAEAGTRVIDGLEGPILPCEAVIESSIKVGSNYEPIVVDRLWSGDEGTRIADGCVLPVIQLESLGCYALCEISDDRASAVDPVNP